MQIPFTPDAGVFHSHSCLSPIPLSVGVQQERRDFPQDSGSELNPSPSPSNLVQPLSSPGSWVGLCGPISKGHNPWLSISTLGIVSPPCFRGRTWLKEKGVVTLQHNASISSPYSFAHQWCKQARRKGLVKRTIEVFDWLNLSLGDRKFDGFPVL